MRLTEWNKCIEFLDNLHCTSKQCVLPHMPTVILLFPCVNIDCTSKLFNLDSVWVTLEYGLFFLNCYEWCKFPFTQWSVLFCPRNQFLILFIHGNFIQSDAKKCKHTRQEKITIFRGKEKKRYFYIHRRPILYQTENHDHY